MELVVLFPFLDLGLSQSLDILGGVDGSLAAADVQEIQALGSLVQILLITSGIAQLTERVSLDQSSGLGVVLLLANDLLHGCNLLSEKTSYGPIIHIFVRKSSINAEKIESFSKYW